ncbi:MAG: acetate--CoA ligase [Bryobacteraceae bacterium]|nr:acetate--CoA ligase [Bryobacteraceae bacterium]
MAWKTIRKPAGFRDPPNLRDYDSVCREFRWEAVGEELGAKGGINIAKLAVDRHAEGARAGHVALRWLSRQGGSLEYTYADLKRETARFANLLECLGLRPGERVFAFTPRIPPLYIAALGTLKYRAVFCPLFSAFGPEPLFQRLSRGDGRVLVTTERLYRKNVEPIRSRLAGLQHVLLVDTTEDAANGVKSLTRALASMPDAFEIPETSPEDMALLHFTSGTTGMPKGAVHVHEAALMHYMTGKYALDLRPGDVFWCTADPGWVTGTSYGIIAPLLHGATNLVDEADFDAVRWYETLQRQRVNVWYTAPTAIRLLMRLPVMPKDTYDLSALRFIASVGEPLNPSAVVWGVEAFGMPIHDNWWQTETGGIMIANFRSMDIRPGSMGRPLPGVETGLVRRLAGGGIEEIREAGVEGELALKPGWPSMFRGYLHEQERYRKCFAGGWYLTGDLAQRDAEGNYFFVGRADDIIKTAGHMVGPFEVESLLMEHPAVAEAGVIGKPDPVIGEVVKAFVVLKPGFEPGEDLRLELIGFARKRMGSATAPKEIAFEKSLPRTRSGKTMRRLLKNRELGLPEGDTSTLEAAS